MLSNARAYIVAKVEDGQLRGRVIDDENDCSRQEMVEIICLMTYYLMSHNDVYQECLALFEEFQDTVKENYYKEADENSDGEYGIEMALSSLFINMVEEAIKGCNREEEVETIVDRFIEGFFDPEEECLSFEEMDHEDDLGHW